MSVLKRFFTVSGLTVISRVFGVFRESALSHFLGACSEMDAFLIAFKFPSFFRKCFAEGGFHSMFVPFFSDFFVKSKHKGSGIFSSRIFTLLFWTMLLCSILVFTFADQFVKLMAPGFVGHSEKFNLAVLFTRITFPNVAFVALSTVYSGILISTNRFFVVSLLPIAVNIILILSLVFGEGILSAGHRISYGVLLGGIFQFAFLYFYVRYLKLPIPKLTKIKVSPKTRDFLRKLVPVIVGAGVAQFNVFVDSLFGSFLPTGSISFIYFADRFIQLPLALFGISMATVLLPEISKIVTRGNVTDISDLQSRSILFTLRMAIPSTVGLIALAYPLIDSLYGHGKFIESDVSNTKNVLQIFAIGLPAYVVSKIFSSVLFAQKDSKTPIVAAVSSIVCNIVFNSVLIVPFGLIGIAASTSASGFINACIMYKKAAFSFNRGVVVAVSKILVSSLVMWLFISIFFDFEKLNFAMELITILYSVVTGILVYGVSLYFLRDEMAVKFAKKVFRFAKCLIT